MSCIASPMITDKGAMYLKAPPTFHWHRAATSNASPPALKPTLPVSHLANAIPPVVASGVLLASEAEAPRVDTTSAMAQAPETAVNTPDIPNNPGTTGVAQRSRMIYVRTRNHAATASVIPDVIRAALLIP